jgi:hypothetical protein
MKNCNRCKQNLPFESFTTNKKNADGYGQYCKSCHSKNAKEYYLRKKGIVIDMDLNPPTKDILEINNIKEEWKDIEGYLGEYEISSFGRIWNSKHGRYIKTSLSGNKRWGQYKMVRLNKKNYYIHRLIAIHFIQNADNHSDVHHINENKLDNRIENLMWIDQTEHCQISPKGYGLKNGNGKLTEEQVLDIRKNYIPYKTPFEFFAKKYNVSRGSIENIISRKTFKYLVD